MDRRLYSRSSLMYEELVSVVFSYGYVIIVKILSL